ncbi:Rha family transcriptional regulator [Lysinibacillus sp. NPDC097279]|uniref:Rha family transcriptional regulator n=1 Tax=Lysinibacillus sp. NPDC097279 TaxID=3364143 RepID=UPI00381B3C26
MNQLKVVSFNGQLVTDSRDVAKMVGIRHSDLLEKIGGSKKVTGYITHLTNGKFRSSDFFIQHSYSDDKGEMRPCYLLTRKGCEMVANKMTGEKGVLFTATYVTRFEEMEQIISQASLSRNFVDFEKQLIGVKYTSEILRVDWPSKIRMLEEVHKQHGVPTNHLPKYSEEERKVALTHLLKEHGVKISAAKANTRLIELGLLEIKERPSSNGSVKEFKSLTDQGLYYGSNVISPHNPKETQPLYYPSKFGELLSLLQGKTKEVS